jgi:hypothetical protein
MHPVALYIEFRCSNIKISNLVNSRAECHFIMANKKRIKERKNK